MRQLFIIQTNHHFYLSLFWVFICLSCGFLHWQRVACSSYQNTVGRQSTGPYSHLSAQYPYQMNGNDYSHTSQYGYNSWGMWRDSRNLTPSSSFTTKDRSSFKSFTIILITAAFIVVVAVLSVAALAFYFSTFKSDDCKWKSLCGKLFSEVSNFNCNLFYSDHGVRWTIPSNAWRRVYNWSAVQSYHGLSVESRLLSKYDHGEPGEQRFVCSRVSNKRLWNGTFNQRRIPRIFGHATGSNVSFSGL